MTLTKSSKTERLGPGYYLVIKNSWARDEVDLRPGAVFTQQQNYWMKKALSTETWRMEPGLRKTLGKHSA